MDEAYQFGQIQVSCEGYDYPDDPYVLKGSCGVSVDCSHCEGFVKYSLGY